MFFVVSCLVAQMRYLIDKNQRLESIFQDRLPTFPGFIEIILCPRLSRLVSKVERVYC